MLALVDNYDSFSYNLVCLLERLGCSPTLIKNDASDWQVKLEGAQQILLSPGPSHPQDAGITLDVIQKFAGQVPILGVCLGHQALAHAFGGQVIQAKQVMHGKTAQVFHDGQGLFAGVPNPVQVARYHSLLVCPKSLPQGWVISAWTQNEAGEMDVIMGIRHQTHVIEGVQFHPESVLTQHGEQMLANFLQRPA